MKFSLALLATFAAAADEAATEASSEPQYYEVTTVTTTTETVDVPAEANEIYTDYVVILDRMTIEDWAQGLKGKYDLLMRDWERSLEHFEFEIKALNEDYWVAFRPLIAARKDIYRRRHAEVVQYVIDNTYFHGASIEHVVPEVEALLRNEFNPAATNIVSMFGLSALSLAEDQPESFGLSAENSEDWMDLQNHTFTFNFNEEEVVAWFRDNQAKYDDVAQKYQDDFNTFVADVNEAVETYRAGEARVEDLYEQIVRNAAADAEFYWQLHFDSPLADVVETDFNGDGMLLQ